MLCCFSPVNSIEMMCYCIYIAALKFCFKTCVVMKFVDDDDDVLLSVEPAMSAVGQHILSRRADMIELLSKIVCLYGLQFHFL